jgi:hypothetical protein
MGSDPLNDFFFFVRCTQRYTNRTENPTGYQHNFLRALVNGIHSEFMNADIIKQYNLGCSANVSRLKKALEQKERIDITGKNVTQLHLLFGYWLKSKFWK